MITLCSAFSRDADTVSKTFPGISIQADRYIFNEEKSFTSYSIISKSDISLSNPRQVSELLSRESGLFIKDYGGLSGIKTISLRGTSSQQTLIMLEGMRLNSIQSNSSDLSTIPVSMLRSVEIIKGGSSAVNGASSLGGTLNFNLDYNNENKLNAGFGYGSFNEYFASISASTLLSNNVRVGLSGEYVSSGGAFSFTTTQYGIKKEYKRENADFENLSLMLNSFFRIGDWQNKLITLGRITERGSPGAILLGYISPDQSRLYEKDLNIIYKTGKNFNEDYLSFGLLYRFNNQKYYSPQSLLALMGDTTTYFTTNEFQFKTDYEFNAGDLRIQTGMESGYSHLQGDMLQNETKGKVSRIYSGAMLRTAYTLTSELYSNSFMASVRYDVYSDLQPSPTAMLGSSFSFNKLNLNLKTQLSYNYRPPSFNEMYYLNYGTSDLKPERSLSYSITFEYSKSIFNAEISGFMIDTEDQIVAIPKSPLVWSARNMASVLSRGIEFNTVIDVVDNFLILKMNYTIQRVTDNEWASETYKKLVQYVPQELASADVSLKHSGFHLNAACRYTGFAFALPDNSYESLMNSLWLFDINLNKRIELSGTEINFKLGILNIFDTRYSVVKNYPMPGRIIRIGIDFKL